MERLPYWRAEHWHTWNSGRLNNWKDAVLKCWADPTLHMQALVRGVIRHLGIVDTMHYHIPVLKLPRENIITRDDKEDGVARPDALETLFARVNSEGTRLEGEELNYAILKSIYPHAEQLVEGLSTRLIAPSRLVTFVSRLVLPTSDSGGRAHTPPPFWKDWRWWNSFAAKISDMPHIVDWFQQNLTSHRDGVIHDACSQWVERLKHMPQRPSPLVLYAQRQWLAKWFPEYDPARPDQLEDTDRPWDIDHIHPSNYVYRRWYIPQIIKDWHSCIGNLHAWPLETNRTKQDTSPARKLSEPDEREKILELCNGQQIRTASFIEKDREWQPWHDSTPQEAGFSDKYLANSHAPDGLCRSALIQAITSRWIRLYEEWYNTLLVKSLCIG
jgi:hypothetical protein